MWEYFIDINISCLKNVFLFQFKIQRCGAFFFVKSETQESPQFRFDILIKKSKVSVWFIMYLMQNVYKYILLFHKTSLFLAMLLTCGTCHLCLRMVVFMCWITTESVRSLEEHTRKKETGDKLAKSLVPFHISSQMMQMHRCYSKWVCVSLTRHCS